MPIIAYQRNETAGSQVMMESVVMQGKPMADAPVEYRPAEMGELVDAVASYRNTADAIGYSVYYYVTEMYVQQGIKLLAVDGVAPPTRASQAAIIPIRNTTTPWCALTSRIHPRRGSFSTT